MPAILDALGQRGEAIFRVLITKFDSHSGPLFNPKFLGDKWRGVDFIVELVGTGPTTPYFFVQVKTTRLGYTAKEHRLKVNVSTNQTESLLAYPAPAYVVGIDEVTERGFIVAPRRHATGRPQRLPGLSTRYPIDRDCRRILWEEVQAFWERYNVVNFSSRFVDADWR